MAKRRTKANLKSVPAPTVSAPPAIPAGLPSMIASQLAGLGPLGPVQPMEVSKAESDWSNFTLKDGTILRIRPTIENVRHEPGRYNDKGEPIYHFQIGLAVTSVVPPHLMQGFVKPRKRSKSKTVRRKKR